MKRLYTIVVALCLCVSLVVACGPTPDPQPNGPETPETPENPSPEPEPDPEPQPTGRNELTKLDGYPEGMRVYNFKNYYEDGTDDFCIGHYAIVDVASNPKLKFNAVYVENDATPSDIFDSFEGGTPLLATNGGYFWDGESLSLLISDGRVESIAAQYTWPSYEGQQYTACPIRAAFGVHADGRMEATWVYCCPDDDNKPYSFTSAKGNNEKVGVFTSTPHKSTDGTLWTPQEAIGGGPMLLEDGKNVAERNYWKEVLHSGGTAGLSYQPRTAIGYTADGKIILIVCDGRGLNGSWGYKLPDLADLLKSLGAVWAINLDGGGSSVMVGKDGTSLGTPSDGAQRRVPTAIVISLQE